MFEQVRLNDFNWPQPEYLYKYWIVLPLRSRDPFQNRMHAQKIHRARALARETYHMRKLTSHTPIPTTLSAVFFSAHQNDGWKILCFFFFNFIKYIATYFFTFKKKKKVTLNCSFLRYLPEQPRFCLNGCCEHMMRYTEKRTKKKRPTKSYAIMQFPLNKNK